MEQNTNEQNTTEQRAQIIKRAVAACVIAAVTLWVCFVAFAQKGFGWFSSNREVAGTGMSVSLDADMGTMSFEAAYAGNFKLSDEINFGIDNSLLLYPENYITVVFDVITPTKFSITVQEKILTDEEFVAQFGNRRDLLLGDYTYDEAGASYFDVEDAFDFVDYAGGGYAQFSRSLPARPSISLDVGSDEAFNDAYDAYLENSIPYMMDFLYRFSKEHSMFDAITFSLYIQDGGTLTEYLLLPTGEVDENGAREYAPAFSRTHVGETTGDWSAVDEDGVTLQQDPSKLYALVLGYCTEIYHEESGTAVSERPVHPHITVTEEDAALFCSAPAGGQTTTPYLGTYYCNNYNCFIGRSLAVKFTTEAEE